MKAPPASSTITFSPRSASTPATTPPPAPEPTTTASASSVTPFSGTNGSSGAVGGRSTAIGPGVAEDGPVRVLPRARIRQPVVQEVRPRDQRVDAGRELRADQRRVAEDLLARGLRRGRLEAELAEPRAASRSPPAAPPARSRAAARAPSRRRDRRPCGPKSRADRPGGRWRNGGVAEGVEDGALGAGEEAHTSLTSILPVFSPRRRPMNASGALDPLDDGLAVTDLPVAQPAAHVADEIRRSARSCR